MSDYGIQIKAFFHFSFKHLFQIEFGIRVAVEIFIFFLSAYLFLRFFYRIIYKITSVLSKITCSISREIVMPLHIRLFEKLAFATNNPNWQARANKMKDSFKKIMGERTNIQKSKNPKKKSHKIWWILSYLVLAGWIIGFHYWGEAKRSSYEVFFLAENVILEVEDWTVNTWLNTDEHAIECFFHDEIEAD